MKKNIIILVVLIGIFQLGLAQISYYRSINSDFTNPYNMIISPDNRFCYVAGSSNLQVYERNEATGELTLISTIEQTNDGTEIWWGYSMVISPDSSFLYLGFREYIGVFEVNTASGLLTPIMTVEYWEGPSSNITNNCLVLSQDGRYLYNSVRDDVILFGRDINTGQLAFIGEYSDLNPTPGLTNEESCTLSPDNKFIYATGGHGITSFRRDEVTGLLTFKQEIRGSNYENTALTYARESLVSFDNRFLYTITNTMGSGALVVLAIDPVTDSLSIFQIHPFEFSPYELVNPNSLTFSPNHKAIVVSSDEEAAFFETDTVSGHIKLINTFMSRSYFDNNMGGRKIYEQGNQYLYSNPAFKDSIYIYRANVFFNDHVYLCPGEPIELSPFIGYQSYLWSTGSTEPTIIVTDSGQYVLQVTDQFNNHYTDTVFVAIDIPEVNLGNDTTLHFGEYIILDAGYGYAQYIWNPDDWTQSYYIFEYDSTITVDSVEISVMVTNEHGCTNADTILIHLKPNEGITEPHSSTFSLDISPNPADNTITIALPSDSPVNNTSLVIYNVNARQVICRRITEPTTILGIGILPRGVYFVKVSDDRNVQVGKFVKQ
jgi:6-phosphogluconolactonase (cycloisomerase 2 family)